MADRPGTALRSRAVEGQAGGPLGGGRTAVPDGIVAAVVQLSGDLGLDVVERALERLGHPGVLIAAVDAGLVTATADLGGSGRLPDVAPGQAREVHAAIAEAIGRGGPLAQRDRRAMHLAAATLLPDDLVADEVAEAAKALRVTDQLEAAVERFVQAARLTSDLTLRATRLRGAGEAMWLLSRFEDAAPVLEEAYAITADPVVRADVAIILGQIELWNRGAHHALAVLVPAAEAVASVDADRASALFVHAASTVVVSVDAAASIRFARRAMELAEAGTGAVVPAAHVAMLMALVQLGEVEEADVHRQPLEELAWGMLDIDGIPELEHLLNALGMAATITERWDTGEAYLERVVFRARNAGSPSMLAMAAGCLGELRFRTGRVEEAQKLLQGEVDAGSAATGPIPRAWIDGLKARAEAVLSDDSQAARRHAERSIEAGEILDAAMVELWGRYAMGLIELAAGDPATAALHLDRVAAATAAGGLREPGLAWWQVDHVEALWRSGREHEAVAALGRLRADAALTKRVSALGGVARSECLMAADAKRAEKAATEALDRFAALPAPFEVARTLLIRGERRLGWGDLDTATADLEAAISLLEGLGARPWLRRAAALRDDVVRASDPLLGLTAAERRVVEEVARGARNRDIAEALHVSQRTVETHLAHIFQKLDVANRTQLATLAGTGRSPGA